MPLSTQIKRKGRARKVRWGQFHVAAMTLAAAIDSYPTEGDEGRLGHMLHEHNADAFEADKVLEIGPRDVWDLVSYPVIAATPLNSKEYTMTRRMVFIDTTDGEKFIIEAGDVLSAWR